MAAYIPRKGDMTLISFNPQAGHEIKGYRPALVISNDLFNKATGFAIVCPITSTDRQFPFHVRIPDGHKISGFIMVEQARSVDYRSRGMKLVQSAPAATMQEVLDIYYSCIF